MLVAQVGVQRSDPDDERLNVGHNRRWWRFARLATHIILPTREIDVLGVPRLGR